MEIKNGKIKVWVVKMSCTTNASNKSGARVYFLTKEQADSSPCTASPEYWKKVSTDEKWVSAGKGKVLNITVGLDGEVEIRKSPKSYLYGYIDQKGIAMPKFNNSGSVDSSGWVPVVLKEENGVMVYRAK